MKSTLWRSVVGWGVAGFLAFAAVPASASANEAAAAKPAGKERTVIGIFIPQERLDSLSEELAQITGLSAEEIREKIVESGREVTPRVRRHGAWGGHRHRHGHYHHGHRHMGPKGAHPGWHGWHPGMKERMADPEAREAFIKEMKERASAHLDQWLEEGRLTQEEYDALKEALESGDWKALHRHWHAKAEQDTDEK